MNKQILLPLLNSLQLLINKIFTEGQIHLDDKSELENMQLKLNELSNQSKELSHLNTILLSTINLIMPKASKRNAADNIEIHDNGSQGLMYPLDNLLLVNDAIISAKISLLNTLDVNLPKSPRSPYSLNFNTLNSTLNFKGIETMIEICKAGYNPNRDKIVQKLLNKDPHPIFTDARMINYFAQGIHNGLYSYIDEKNVPLFDDKIIGRIGPNILPFLVNFVIKSPCDSEHSLTEIAKLDINQALSLAKMLLTPKLLINIDEHLNALPTITKKSIALLAENSKLEKHEDLIFNFFSDCIKAFNTILNPIKEDEDEDDIREPLHNFIEYLPELLNIVTQINPSRMLNYILDIYDNTENLALMPYFSEIIQSIDKTSVKTRLINKATLLVEDFLISLQSNPNQVSLYKSELAHFLPFLFQFNDEAILELYKKLLWAIAKQEKQRNKRDFNLIREIKILGMAKHIAVFKEKSAELFCEFYQDKNVNRWAKIVWAPEAISIIHAYKSPTTAFDLFSPYVDIVEDVLKSAIKNRYFFIERFDEYLRIDEYEFFDKSMTYETLDKRWYSLFIYYYNLYKEIDVIPDNLKGITLTRIHLKDKITFNSDPILHLLAYLPFHHPDYFETIYWLFDENRPFEIQRLDWTLDTDFFMRVLREKDEVIHNRYIPLLLGYYRRLNDAFKLTLDDQKYYDTVIRWWSRNTFHIGAYSEEINIFPKPFYDMYQEILNKAKSFKQRIKTEFKGSRDSKEDWIYTTDLLIDGLEKILPSLEKFNHDTK
ncbi:hypothetical protein [Thorsellia anophelis]|uniref:Uncharacterized protein n=1 Tax=Thorsellia anophelis DSM 18579 TaxID=1123402 RepID=A0A1I0FLQ5_9GAMM|nr:hypothetical protein [Thorsellia anophelis]SET58424.1 hypothetical protein SAMN02583745_02792 [Thorsellia anophelis DSM 18579]